MKKILILLGIVSLSACSRNVMTKYNTDFNNNTFKKNGYTLFFESNDSGFSEETKKELIETFFKVYPTIVKDFNPNAVKSVYFKIDTAYKGVAATSGSHVVFNPKWFVQNPKDIDVVTHEIMHIVQNYGSNSGPWWVTEGVADYVRYKYGIANEIAGWTLTPFNNNQNYDNGYRITARFLAWIEKKIKKGIVKTIDGDMRSKTYNDLVWKELTGKSIEELWSEYSKNPSI